MSDELDHVYNRLKQAHERIAELKAALKPFADKVEYTTGTNDDDYMDPVFKLGECRAARDAYLGEKE